MSVISITFKYSTDPIVLAVLKEFHVFPVGDSNNRLGPAVVVGRNSIPTASNPLTVSVPDKTTQIEVVPISIDGFEGESTRIPVNAGTTPIPEPPPTTAGHIMMFGQTRFLTYEVSPGCQDCENVFPQGCDLLRLHDAQCSFYQIATAPGVYNWTILDGHLDSCEARGIQVLYTFSYTPEWAYDTTFVPAWPDPGVATPHSNYPPRIDEFEKFFRALLAHVKRPDGTYRIQYFEAWNESNALAFWNGTDAILLEQQQMLWRVLQEVAPTCLLTTPTPTKNVTLVEDAIDTYLGMGFQNYSHIISFHGYWDKGTPGNAIGPTLQAINNVMKSYGCQHPLWDTEWNWTQGYPDDGSISIDEVPKWIEDALLVRMQNNIACSIWFQWDNPNGCGYMLSDPQWKGHINQAGYAWIDYYNSIHPLPQVTDLAQV